MSMASSPTAGLHQSAMPQNFWSRNLKIKSFYHLYLETRYYYTVECNNLSLQYFLSYQCCATRVSNYANVQIWGIKSFSWVAAMDTGLNSVAHRSTLAISLVAARDPALTPAVHHCSQVSFILISVWLHWTVSPWVFKPNWYHKATFKLHTVIMMS